MRPALFGLGIGMVFAYLGARLLMKASVLVGVGAMDPKSFAGGTSMLLVAALVASFIPARRALGIDPMQTLREE